MLYRCRYTRQVLTTRREWFLSTLPGTGAVILLLAFAVLFRPAVPQLGVDLLWLSAVGLWILQVWVWQRQEEVIPYGVRRAGQGRQVMRAAGPFAGFALIFSACWLPFYDNWRWAYTGDSLAWFEIAYATAANGPWQNLLSLLGVDGNFSYLHSLAFQFPQFLFEPGLFWHRVGKLIASLASLGAVYAFCRRTLGAGWGLAAVAAIATNHVWLWFSYVSYGHVDSHFFAFGSLLLVLYVAEWPDRRLRWAAWGLLAGLSVFFTQTAWTEVAAGAVALGWIAWRQGRPQGLVTAGATAFLVASPALLQWPRLLKMIGGQARPLFDPDYLWRIFRSILLLAYDSSIYDIGVQGPYLPAPLGVLYLAGLAICGLGLSARLRRVARLPRVASFLGVLLIVNVLLMTLTNNAYLEPSTKRTFHLVPYQVIVALLPLWVAAQWLPARRAWRMAAATATAGCIAIYAWGGLRLILWPRPAVYGFNVFDGLIELRQRVPHRPVVLFSSRERFRDIVLGKDSVFARWYRLRDNTAVETEFTGDALRRACLRGALLCVEPNFDRDRFARMTAGVADRLRRYPLLASEEMWCYELPRDACPG